MKAQRINALIVFILFLVPNVNFGQAPDLGAASSFALFTANGAFNNVGATSVIGDVGTNAGVFNAFPPGTVDGQIHVTNSTSGLAATAVLAAYNDLEGRTGGTVISTTLEGQSLTPGLYDLGAAASLNGNLTLNGGGDPNALFIIQIDGALLIGASITSTVTLVNSASLCNVYWQIGGQFDLGAGSVFRGTAVVKDAINLLEGSSLLGRGLSTAGAITLNNNIVNFVPAAAGAITGTTTVCQGQAGVSYSVPVIAEAASYSWTLPTGATGTSSTNSITVNYGVSAVSGTITVKGNNSCGGDGTASTLAITVNPLPLTSAIYHQ
ncbi:MAG: hypothetical protein A2W90_09470 [Bacteroidetes bacterium GWF2_42_66]|nr:MAG: hypothetical protein A2W92_00160 [Bacteroidetes bacterium GWA2_42_15]OFY01734.1 MAG: hypothetical protein A2W89_22675 [Bacteroidetes bacterium GWE2_42_39]OFY46481.1 MAG: hypothetical protein A2W90_09470 [Bacteroidetes bacterium GWF2_42_66]HAZ02933.1 hypothetical protein [Marinilabiliales bacterium]HBL76112.1 hypothetical protein [Prolixibacteraceae bacterium]